MYVDAPRRTTNGSTDSKVGFPANLAPQSTSPTAGFSSEREAIAAAMAMNAQVGTTAITAQTARSDMQSGVIGYKKYRNTFYRARYLRRTAIQHDITLYESTSATRYRCEALPIGLGYSGGFTTGWFDNSLQEIIPWGGDLSFEGVYNRTVIESLRRRGIVECKQKMLDSKLDLAESLVDIDKTVGLIAKRASQVLTAWHHVRKGQLDKALHVLGLRKRHWKDPNNLAKAWLEMQYGWLPLINDVFGAVEVVKDLLGDPLAHHSYAKRRVRESLWIRGIGGNSDDWGSQSQSSESFAEVETKFRFRIEDSVLAYITSFQLSNPLYVLWVSVPFTFVVDWFVPIGDWLSSLTATLGLKFVDGYQTTKTFASSTVQARRRRASVWAYWSFKRNLQPAKSRIEMGCIQRAPLMSWPMSYTYFKFPFSSPQRIASAIALTQLTAR